MGDIAGEGGESEKEGDDGEAERGDRVGDRAGERRREGD